MKTLAPLSNIVLVAVTCLIVVTEGLPVGPFYLAFTLLMFLVPVLTVVALARRSSAGGSAVRMAAAVGSLVLLAAVCWALVAQYPSPEGAGVIPFAVLAVLTPALSVAALLRALGQRQPRADAGGRRPTAVLFGGLLALGAADARAQFQGHRVRFAGSTGSSRRPSK